jgi:ribose transport system permease protein
MSETESQPTQASKVAGETILAGKSANHVLDPKSGGIRDNTNMSGIRGFLVDTLPGYAMLILFGILAVVFSMVMPESFATLRNARALLAQNAVVSIAALAAMMPLIVGKLDISFASMFGLASVLAAGMLEGQGIPLPITILIILTVASLWGSIHALLIVRFDLDSLVVTLGSSSILTGLVLLYTGGRVLYEGFPEPLLKLGSGTFLGIQYPVFIMIAIGFIMWFALNKPPWGRHLYATGDNKEAARLRGLPTSRLMSSVFVISSVTAAIGGILLAARNGVGHPTVYNKLLLPAFAAAYLGTAAFRIGRFNPAGTILAMYLLAMGANGLKFMGAPFWVDDVFNGVALVVAIGLAKIGRRAQLRRRGR